MGVDIFLLSRTRFFSNGLTTKVQAPTTQYLRGSRIFFPLLWQKFFCILVQGRELIGSGVGPSKQLSFFVCVYPYQANYILYKGPIFVILINQSVHFFLVKGRELLLFI